VLRNRAISPPCMPTLKFSVDSSMLVRFRWCLVMEILSSPSIYFLMLKGLADMLAQRLSSFTMMVPLSSSNSLSVYI